MDRLPRISGRTGDLFSPHEPRLEIPSTSAFSLLTGHNRRAQGRETNTEADLVIFVELSRPEIEDCRDCWLILSARLEPAVDPGRDAQVVPNLGMRGDYPNPETWIFPPLAPDYRVASLAGQM